MIKETLIWSDYQFYGEKPSIIDPLKKVQVEAGFGCPHCHKVIRKPVTIEHGQTFTHDCGLRMTRYGNSLDCEIDAGALKAAEFPAEID